MCEAMIGLLGAIIGAAVALVAVFFKHSLEVADRERRDAPRRKLLRQMLEDPRHDWRDFDTLARVIGADRPDATRLLIEVGARGSEQGNDVWALISKKPLP